MGGEQREEEDKGRKKKKKRKNKRNLTTLKKKREKKSEQMANPTQERTYNWIITYTTSFMASTTPATCCPPMPHPFSTRARMTITSVLRKRFRTRGLY